LRPIRQVRPLRLLRQKVRKDFALCALRALHCMEL